ncbi:nitrogen regulation protein NR(II) [Dongia sp.]|uniref:two-component system sensor histidine kinase NtrB n=1 Tax=Dongia sp. TaxID=1977262 RepID=UPI0035B4D2D4
MSRPNPAVAIPKLALAPGTRNLPLMPDALTLLEAVPLAIVGLDADNRVSTVNAAAESLLGISRAQLIAKPLHDHIAADSPLFALIDAARAGASAVGESDMSLSGPRLTIEHAAVDVAMLSHPVGHVALLIQDRGLEWRLAQQAVSKDAARSAKAIAGMLAHEVKNPLSGIRGAAQLLESKVQPSDRQLTQLICEETDRIVGMVNGLEVFTDSRPSAMQPVNIHEVLEHVRRLAQAGFARDVAFREEYDPSLPAVLGNRDQLIQVFLNLFKNAAEAAPARGAQIVLGTRYRPGLTVSEPGSASRRRLGLVVTIQDNGSGVPEALKAQLFEPFVSGKAGGKGLGLALVAKIVNDHGGMIDCDSQPGRTTFSVILPIADGRGDA